MRTDAVAQVPAFGALKLVLDSKIAEVNDLVKRLSDTTKGASEDKAKWRAKLVLLLSVACGAGSAYGRRTNNVELTAQFSHSASAFQRQRDTELIQMAHHVVELVGTVSAQLVDFGITSSVMDELRAALDHFEAKNPRPIVNIYTSEADRAELLAKAFELSNFVLEDMLRAASAYKLLNPNFYKSLENASRISKVGIRHDDPAAAADPAANNLAGPPDTVVNAGSALPPPPAGTGAPETPPTEQ